MCAKSTGVVTHGTPIFALTYLTRRPVPVASPLSTLTPLNWSIKNFTVLIYERNINTTHLLSATAEFGHSRSLALVIITPYTTFRVGAELNILPDEAEGFIFGVGRAPRALDFYNDQQGIVPVKRRSDTLCAQHSNIRTVKIDLVSLGLVRKSSSSYLVYIFCSFWWKIEGPPTRLSSL